LVHAAFDILADLRLGGQQTGVWSEQKRNWLYAVGNQISFLGLSYEPADVFGRLENVCKLDCNPRYHGLSKFTHPDFQQFK